MNHAQNMKSSSPAVPPGAAPPGFSWLPLHPEAPVQAVPPAAPHQLPRAQTGVQSTSEHGALPPAADVNAAGRVLHDSAAAVKAEPVTSAGGPATAADPPAVATQADQIRQHAAGAPSEMQQLAASACHVCERFSGGMAGCRHQSASPPVAAEAAGPELVALLSESSDNDDADAEPRHAAPLYAGHQMPCAMQPEGPPRAVPPLAAVPSAADTQSGAAERPAPEGAGEAAAADGGALGQATLPSIELTALRSIQRCLYLSHANAAQLLGKLPDPEEMAFVAEDLQDRTYQVTDIKHQVQGLKMSAGWQPLQRDLRLHEGCRIRLRYQAASSRIYIKKLADGPDLPAPEASQFATTVEYTLPSLLKTLLVPAALVRRLPPGVEVPAKLSIVMDQLPMEDAVPVSYVRHFRNCVRIQAGWSRVVAALGLTPGSRVWLQLRPTEGHLHIRMLPSSSGAAMDTGDAAAAGDESDEEAGGADAGMDAAADADADAEADAADGGAALAQPAASDPVHLSHDARAAAAPLVAGAAATSTLPAASSSSLRTDEQPSFDSQKHQQSIRLQLQPPPYRLYLTAAQTQQLLGSDVRPPDSVTFTGPALAGRAAITVQNAERMRRPDARGMELNGPGWTALRAALQLGLGSWIRLSSDKANRHMHIAKLSASELTAPAEDTVNSCAQHTLSDPEAAGTAQQGTASRRKCKRRQAATDAADGEPAAGHAQAADCSPAPNAAQPQSTGDDDAVQQEADGAAGSRVQGAEAPQPAADVRPQAPVHKRLRQQADTDGANSEPAVQEQQAGAKDPADGAGRQHPCNGAAAQQEADGMASNRDTEEQTAANVCRRKRQRAEEAAADSKPAGPQEAAPVGFAAEEAQAQRAGSDAAAQQLGNGAAGNHAQELNDRVPATDMQPAVQQQQSAGAELPPAAGGGEPTANQQQAQGLPLLPVADPQEQPAGGDAAALHTAEGAAAAGDSAVHQQRAEEVAAAPAAAQDDPTDRTGCQAAKRQRVDAGARVPDAGCGPLAAPCFAAGLTAVLAHAAPPPQQPQPALAPPAAPQQPAVAAKALLDSIAAAEAAGSSIAVGAVPVVPTAEALVAAHMPETGVKIQQNLLGADIQYKAGISEEVDLPTDMPAGRGTVSAVLLGGCQNRFWIGDCPGDRSTVGAGVFAREPIAVRKFICEIAGDVQAAAEFEAAERTVAADPAAPRRHYFHMLPPAASRDEALVINMRRRGNVARFVNHGCGDAANLRLVPVALPNALPRLVLMTTRHIHPGDELLLDYLAERGSRAFSRQEREQAAGLGMVPCLCGGAFCRGLTL